jgi:peptide-methionine (S)-S-oxide reductase
MATAWQLSNHSNSVAVPAMATGKPAARTRVRQVQNSKAKSANKPLVAGKTRAVKIGLRASSESIFFPSGPSYQMRICFIAHTIIESKLMTNTSVPQALTQAITLGGGCFWCTEAVFVRVKGVLDVESGYCNGHTLKPTYVDVCTGQTGHNEVVRLVYDPQVISLREVLEIFFVIHDPTTLNRQGNDKGTQYASVIYAYDQKQFDIATRVKKEVQAMLDAGELKKAYSSIRVSTDVRMVEAPFFPAQQGHQDYLMKHPGGYCNHRLYVKEWPTLAKKSEAEEGARSDL